MNTLLSVALMILHAITFLPQARAAFPAATSSAEALDGENTKGLCTSDNVGMLHYDTGICLALRELMDKPCMADLVERLRKRFTGELKPELGMPYECQAKEGGKITADIGKDKTLWREFLISHVMGTCISETNLSMVEPKPNSNPGYGGACNLHKEQMDAEENKCGCETINSKNSSDPNVRYAGDKGGTGPYDNHAAFMCAAYISLKWADKDGTFMGGDDERTRKPAGYETPKEKTSQGDSRKGAARFWASLEDKKQEREIASSKAKSSKLGRKIKAYCEKQAFNVRQFNEDFPNGGKVRAPNGGGRDSAIK
jgi:hypothetical protein